MNRKTYTMPLNKILLLKNKISEILELKKDLEKAKLEINEELSALKKERVFLTSLNKRIADIESRNANTSNDIAVLAKAIGELYLLLQDVILLDNIEDTIKNKKKITYH